ncbi:MAG TPA: thermonuclease family protein [Pseudolabrys sp.]|nr:thermonuclease family protein [Pseudolabrys sp.]
MVLDDGREVRLAGLDVPNGYAPAKNRLQELLADRPLIIKRLGIEADRYGRLQVYAFTAEPGTERSIQQALLASGNARVAAHVGDKACAAALLAQERRARKAGLGLWGEPAFQAHPADKPAELLAELGRFTLVEGKVLSVRDNTGTIYMNFGRRWSESFTVTISKRNESTFKAAGIEPKRLEGRRIRVRGTLEMRGGPVIEATRPEQIETAELN